MIWIQRIVNNLKSKLFESRKLSLNIEKYINAMRDLRNQAYAVLPQFVLTIFRPFVRARVGASSPLLSRFAVPYAQGMYALGRNHWEQHVIQLGLTGHQAVLDLGCGVGQWLPILAQYNGRVVGIDPEAGLLEIAANHVNGAPNINLARSLAEPLCFQLRSFSAVLCYAVLHYTNHEKVVQEINQVLEPGGRLVLGLPGLGYYLNHVIEGVRFRNLRAVRYGIEPIITYWAQLCWGRHTQAVTYWTQRRVRRLLQAHGFDVLRVMPSRMDPTFPEFYLGSLYFFCAEARKKAEA